MAQLVKAFNNSKTKNIGYLLPYNNLPQNLVQYTLSHCYYVSGIWEWPS